MKTIALFEVFLVGGGLALASPQAKPQAQEPGQESVIAQPSLGEIARQARERRAKENLKDVPLYTNDDLPKSGEGISVVGPQGARQEGAEAGVSPAGTNLLNEQKMAYLRGKLSQLQQQQALHQRELSVLQQQISQTKMQWSPNPNETLRQEYSRQNINNLANQIDQKKQQIADGQQEIQQVQDELQRLQAKLGWLSEAAPGVRQNAAESDLPPGIEPGTPEYWQARIQAAKQQLATAKERQNLAKNELDLLKLQQLRSLNPNVQASLASSIPQKQAELAAAAEAVARAQQDLEKLQKEAEAASAPRK